MRFNVTLRSVDYPNTTDQVNCGILGFSNWN
jgi:hypothetical protein